MRGDVNTPVGPATQRPKQGSLQARPHPHQVAKALCGTKRKPLALHDRCQEAGTTLDAALRDFSVWTWSGDSAETWGRPLHGTSKGFLSVDMGWRLSGNLGPPPPAHPCRPRCEQPGNKPSFPLALNLSPHTSS